MRRTGRTGGGQSVLEYAVLVAAVASAMLAMSHYVGSAFNGHAKAVEAELNGATEEQFAGVITP